MHQMQPLIRKRVPGSCAVENCGPAGVFSAVSLLLCAALVSRLPRNAAPGQGAGLETKGGSLDGIGLPQSIKKIVTEQFNTKLQQYYSSLTAGTEAATVDNSWPRTGNISLGVEPGANGTLQPCHFTR